MIEYLKIEIIPVHFTGTGTKELRIRINYSGGVGIVETRRLCEPDELVSFFDQIWDCAKGKLLELLKNDMIPSSVPAGIPGRP